MKYRIDINDEGVVAGVFDEKDIPVRGISHLDFHADYTRRTYIKVRFDMATLYGIVSSDVRCTPEQREALIVLLKQVTQGYELP